MSAHAESTLPLAALAALVSLAASSPRPPADWRFHGGDPGHTQYSRLAQIHKGNVHRGKQAWVYRTGDARPDGRSQIQCHPIVVGGRLRGVRAAGQRHSVRIHPRALGGGENG